MVEQWNNGLIHFAFGGTRSVASGHDGAWPSTGLYFPSFHHSSIPTFQ